MTNSQSPPEHEALATSEQTPPTIGVLDWVTSIPFIVGFALLFIICEVLQRLLLPFGLWIHDTMLTGLNQGVIAWLRLMCGMKFEVEQFGERLEKDPDIPVIILSNHQAIFDISILHVLFHRFRPKFIAKKELASTIPGVSFNLRRGKHALIDRKNPRQALAEIRRLGMSVGQGDFAAIIFPEGTRAKRGVIQSFRPAGFSTLLQCAPHAQIIPVTIDGSWKLSAFRCWPMPYGVKVRVVIGAPVAASEHESLKDLLGELHAIIENTLERMRREEIAQAST